MLPFSGLSPPRGINSMPASDQPRCDSDADPLSARMAVEQNSDDIGGIEFHHILSLMQEADPAQFLNQVMPVEIDDVDMSNDSDSIRLWSTTTTTATAASHAGLEASSDQPTKGVPTDYDRLVQRCHAAVPHLFSAVAVSAMPCKCRKSRCLQLYCYCFSSGTLCQQLCRCLNCANVVGSADRDKAVAKAWSKSDNAFTGRPKKAATKVEFCSCKKSRCLQKYCVCYERQTLCSMRCRCIDCENIAQDTGSLEDPSSSSGPDSFSASDADAQGSLICACENAGDGAWVTRVRPV